MRCPECGADKMKVCVTNDYGDIIERVRLCSRCRSYFVTSEKEICKRGKHVQS